MSRRSCIAWTIGRCHWCSTAVSTKVNLSFVSRCWKSYYRHYARRLVYRFGRVWQRHTLGGTSRTFDGGSSGLYGISCVSFFILFPPLFTSVCLCFNCSWRRDYEIVTQNVNIKCGFADLCEKLHSQRGKTTTKNVHGWFSSDKSCVHSYKNSLLNRYEWKRHIHFVRNKFENMSSWHSRKCIESATTLRISYEAWSTL